METTQEKPTLRHIVETTCKEREVSAGLIRGPFRSQYLVWVRALIAVRARQHGYSYADIGRELGGRDHTTIMNLCGYRSAKRKKQ